MAKETQKRVFWNKLNTTTGHQTFMIQIQAYYFCQVFVLDLKNQMRTRSWLVELFQEKYRNRQGYFIKTTRKLRNLFYKLFYLILCSFAKTFCSSCKCTSFPPEFLRFLKTIFFGLGQVLKFFFFHLCSLSNNKVLSSLNSYGYTKQCGP